MKFNLEYYALYIKGMSLVELIEERDRLMSEIREIEEGMCDDDIFVLDPQITYHYNHLYMAEVCRRIGEMNFEDEFEDMFKKL